MSDKAELTCERVKALLQYDPGTGVITWTRSRGKVKAGDTTGTPDKDGYLLVTVDGKKRKSHRLAWAIHYGVWPKGQIDHINHIKTDNRISNLRDASSAVNMQNVSRPNRRSKTQVLGVVHSGSKFKAVITVSGKARHIGTFDTTDLAHAGYVEAKRRLHPGCTI